MSKDFLFPRTQSPLVFALVTALYTGLYTAFVISLATHLSDIISDMTDIFYLIHPIDRKFNDFTPTIHAAEILFLKPLIDTLLIAGLLESLRRSRLSPRWQFIAAVCVMIGALALLSTIISILLIPMFIVYVATYLHWRKTSIESAFAVTLIIQMLHNILPAARLIFAS